MLRRSRHLLALVLVCAVPLSVTACGNHHLLSKAFCIFNVERAFHDFRTGHKIYGALNVALAIHNCRAGFAPNAR